LACALYNACIFTPCGQTEWTLTDCISFVVMQSEGLSDALTGDHHFKQAGFATLLE